MCQISDFTPVEGASDCSLSDNGYIYNVKTRQRLARTWIDMGWQTQVKADDGSIRRIRHDDPDS